MSGSRLPTSASSALTTVAPEALLMALAFSAAVGIFFGLWPPRRAAGLAPIEALRYD